jgi:hypothetical protein
MSQIPYDQLHNMAFADKTFYLTGRFRSGTKEELARLIQARGGNVQTIIRKNDLDYVIVGAKGNKLYVNDTSGRNDKIGRNIEKALKWREQGRPLLSIVHEDTFVEHLQEIA